MNRLARHTPRSDAAKHVYDWDWSGAETEFKRAIDSCAESCDRSPLVRQLLVSLGRSGEALKRPEEPSGSIRVRVATNHLRVGYVLYQARGYDQAIEQFHRNAGDGTQFRVGTQPARGNLRA